MIVFYRVHKMLLQILSCMESNVWLSGDPTEAMVAISRLASKPFTASSSEDSSDLHIIEHPAGHMTLKRLVHNDAERIKQGETGSEKFYWLLLFSLIINGQFWDSIIFFQTCTYCASKLVFLMIFISGTRTVQNIFWKT